MSVKTLLRLNRHFKPVPHPFNDEAAGGKTYGIWEYERGGKTVDCYRPAFSEETMFRGKTVLDVGCGEGGKSIYYAGCGAEIVVGIDVVEEYAAKSAALAESLGLSDKFRFVCGSALALPFRDGTFDTVIMSDFFEHVSEPAAALREAMRVLKDGGMLFINFPPYYHPYGAHLSDAINVPWVHLFFSEKTMIGAYKTLIADKPDAKRRAELKIRSDGDGETLGYINKMTLRRANDTIASLGIKPICKKLIPLRKFLAPAAHLPLLREAFCRMAVYVFIKERKQADEQEKQLSGNNHIFAGGAVSGGNDDRNGI